VRGRAGEELTVEVARAVGAAFTDQLDAPALIVAHDMRLSSPELSRAVIEGAVRRGAIVADAGLSSTDQLYCASGLHHAAGVMITASHNPGEDNGFKLCLPGARPLGRDSGLEGIRAAAEAYLDAGEIPARGEGRSEGIDTLEDYASALRDLVPLPEGRYYTFELIGMQVFTNTGEEVGTVHDVLFAPANDVYVVRRPGRADVLVPAVKHIVTSIDVSRRTMVITPPAGLLDEEGDSPDED